MAEFRAFADRLRQLRAGRSAALVLLETVGSTHLLAQRILEDYAREGSDLPAIDLVAWQQLAGSGRHRRRWSSPPGQGIYATQLRELPSVEQLQGLPLAVAAALCRCLRRRLKSRGGPACQLKWPNDLTMNARKLGGLLIDTKTAASNTRATISFGVNTGAVESFDEAGATSLSCELGGDPLASPALADLAAELFAAVEEALAEPNDPHWVELYCRYSQHRPGDALRCRMRAEEVEGIFLGFDDRGFLRLQVDGGERLISVGEVLNG